MHGLQRVCILLWAAVEYRKRFHQLESVLLWTWSVHNQVQLHNHGHHTLLALLDIIMEALIVDLSREVMHGHKVFHTKHKPDWLSFANANSITADNYVILVQCLMVKLTRRSPTVQIMWMLTVVVVPVNTFITKDTASIWYFPSKN